ncbi:hypothetical protein ACI3L1_06690 [Deinococcus sp. SM5_A1]|uniref:hypothetical protein n=1 Tax=Deinococcus sp. SM5_A1 TaxID=3379094 RepID=UPI00385815E8
MDKDKNPVFIVDGQEVGADGKPIQSAKTEALDQSADVGKLREELAQQKAAYDKLTNRTAARATQLQNDLDAARDQLGKMQTEGQDMAVKLRQTQTRPTLPDDARQRLIAVNGIGEALADKALESLKAPPAGK